jgi:site-specific recombinase XerD
MINKSNWKLIKKYLQYRYDVDQITEGSLAKEQTHVRYFLEWAQDKSFVYASQLRPTLPQYLLTNRLDGDEARLSAVYIKKILATARLFFTWLSDNETGYRHIKQSWVKTLKVKRLTDVPKNKEIVTLEEILEIASRPVSTLFDRRTRAALVFLYLSGMRVGAFVSMPIQAVNISNRIVKQFPSLGVRTKNSKHATTYLLKIPELLSVVQQWDDEVRSLLPRNGFWFAPFSFRTGDIDPSVTEIGYHRVNLARRNFQEWLSKQGLPYHSPHKFKHGHIHYGLLRSKNVADYKAVSQNALHSSMQITDEVYSFLQGDEIQNRLDALTGGELSGDVSELITLLETLLSKMKK